MKPKFIEPVGKRTTFRRLMLAGLATAPDNLYVAPYLGRSFALAATWGMCTRNCRSKRRSENFHEFLKIEKVQN
jgi:hypothetical protein